MLTKLQILEEVKQLSPDDRRDLIDELWQLDTGDDLSEEQQRELQRRIDAADRGEAVFHDGPQVLREIRESLQRRTS